jgi:diguanylate cyclase (GGDEF)-like protein
VTNGTSSCSLADLAAARILLVEDNPDDAELIRRQTGVEQSFHAVHVFDLAAAVSALEADSYDLVLLDLGLPDSFGLGTLRRVLSICPSTPVVVLTGLDDEKAGIDAVQAGAQDYVIKSDLDPRGLTRIVRYSIERHRLRTRLDEARRLAAYRADHDPLTGLSNRGLLMTRLGHSLSQSRRYGDSFGVVYVDLDDFKTINDRFGHAAGDAVLRQVASCMVAGVRQSDTVARIGGDEFVLLMEREPSREEVERDIGRLAARVASSVRVEGEDLRVTLSWGIAMYPDDGQSEDALLRAADAAMYRAKAAKRREPTEPA